MSGHGDTPRYALVSPCRNEAAHLPTTIAAVAAQTVVPARWIVVDDGSTDETPAILEAAQRELPYLEVVRREDRGRRSVGPGVIQAFNDGLARLDLDACDFVCKFDVDLDFGPRYFQRVLEAFEDDPWLGTFSGKLFLRVGERLVEERCGDENSVGPIKFYRTACFRDIGGFVPQVCWDGIDGHLCRIRGWVAESRDEPDLRIVHLRQMGSSHRSVWTGRLRWGGGKYAMGSALHYVMAVCAYRMSERPFVIGGLGILCGYLRAFARGEPRFGNRDYRRFLHRFERTCLLRGKPRAAREFNEAVREAGPPGISASGSSPSQPVETQRAAESR